MLMKKNFILPVEINIGSLTEKGSTTEKALTHNNTIAENEPAWGDVDKRELPLKAFAFEQADPDTPSAWSYPHHWVEGGSLDEESGRYKSGTMYLHRGGLGVARAAANGARSGKKAPQWIIDHLDKHYNAIQESFTPEEEKEFIKSVENMTDKEFEDFTAGVYDDTQTEDKSGDQPEPQPEKTDDKDAPTAEPQKSAEPQTQTNGFITLTENSGVHVVSSEDSSSVTDLEIKGFGNGVIKEFRKKERIVYGAVYLKNKVDSQGDWMEGDEIDKMMQRFMRLYHQGQSYIDYQHDFIPGAGSIVESWKIREGDSIFAGDEYLDAWAVGVKVMDDHAWEAIVNKKINAFSMAGMVDFGKTMTVEVSEEQAKNEYQYIAFFNEDTKQWLVNAYEIKNVRLIAVSLVSRGANLEPRFPLIKSVDGVWKPTNWKNALELKSGGVTSFVNNVVNSVKPTPRGDSVTNKSNNSEDYTMLTKEQIQQMISESLETLKAEFAEMIKSSQSASGGDTTNQNTQTPEPASKGDEQIAQVVDALNKVSTAIAELKTVVEKHDKELKEVEANFDTIEKTFNALTGNTTQPAEPAQKTDEPKTEPAKNTEDAIKALNDKVDGVLASVGKMFNAPSGGTHTQTDSAPSTQKATEDDKLFANMV